MKYSSVWFLALAGAVAMFGAPPAASAQTYDEALWSSLEWRNVGPPRGGRGRAAHDQGAAHRPMGLLYRCFRRIAGHQGLFVVVLLQINGGDAELVLDLVLLDICIPAEMGFSVAEQMHHNGLDTPIVFITGSRKPGLKEEAEKIYRSADYQAVIGKRLDATSHHFAVLVDGLPG